MNKLQGKIVLRDRIITGEVTFDTHLLQITPKNIPNQDPDRYILPGFIDVHVHGGGGADTMDGAEGIEKMARFHMQHGTTTILPTTITRPWKEILNVLRATKEVKEKKEKQALSTLPHIYGVHLEGPFISEKKLGAQPPFTLDPEISLLDALVEQDILRVITLAPEVKTINDAIPLLTKAGVRVSFGHTACTYEQANHAIQLTQNAGGTAGATHLFNAMGGLEGRVPGLVGAILSNDQAYAELIFDTHHVHPVNFQLAHHIMPNRLLFITDAMRGTGMGEGESELGGQKVIIKDGKAMGANGHLAGSILTLDEAFRNALRYGASLTDATALLSYNAARYLGMTDRGEIALGKLADLLVMNARMEIEEVWVGGQRQV